MNKIMFDDKFHLTDAVLNGKKTMTRRVANKVLVENKDQELVWNGEFKPPRYKVGEIVAVAQRYSELSWDARFYEKLKSMCERLPQYELKGWDNKMFVKAELMPHHIQITDVRLERINVIGDNDCLKEGVSKAYIGYYVRGLRTNDWEKESHVEMEGNTYKLFPDPIQAFRALIEKECGKKFWVENNFVYVYTFKLVD